MVRDAAAAAAAPPATQPEPSSGAPLALFSAIAVGLGAAIRLLPVVSSSFPLGDGGLFYVMVQNLLAHNLALPRFTTYNHAHIPFAYPPLGFYLLALLHLVLGAPLLTLFQYLPVIFSVLSVAAFGLLARELLPSRLATVAALFAYALLPDTFFWEIKGGGVARAPGELFALLALRAIARLYRGDSARYILPAALFSALSILSHPEWGYFVVYSAALLFLAFGRSRSGLGAAFVLALGVAALAAPWWLTVVARFGTGPFLSAFAGTPGVYGRFSGLLALLNLDLSNEVGFPLVAALAISGGIVALALRRPLLPLWLLFLTVVDPHGATTLSRTIILTALLAGLGFEVWLNLLKRLVPGPGNRTVAWPLALGIGLLLVRQTLGASVLASADAPISPGERSAMRWVSAHTASRSGFVVVEATDWGHADEAEWFPVLAQRQSLDTVQGSEWIGGAFGRTYRVYAAVEACADKSAGCLAQTFRRYHRQPDYVYIARSEAEGSSPCCGSLVASLASAPGYRLAYHTAGAVIFRRVSG